MKIIQLDKKSYCIPDWLFEELEYKAVLYKQCKVCEGRFNDDQFEATRNICINCLAKILEKATKKDITYINHYSKRVGKVFLDEIETEITLFLEKQSGYIFVFDKQKELIAKNLNFYKSLTETVKYHGFLLPELHDKINTIVDFEPEFCQIIGDFKSNSVIAFAYDNSIQKNGICYYCLLYRHSGFIEIPTKHMIGAIHKLSLAAKKLAEEEKQDNLYYPEDMPPERRLSFLGLLAYMVRIENDRYDIEKTVLNIARGEG